MSFSQSRKLENAKRQLDSAVFDMQRDSVFESRLADWPRALRLHGINIDAAKKEGIEPEDIAYLILSVNGLISFCNAKGVAPYEQLCLSDYRQRLFAQPDTRKAWGYARLCMPRVNRVDIDRFLEVKHGEKYDPL